MEGSRTVASGESRKIIQRPKATKSGAHAKKPMLLVRMSTKLQMSMKIDPSERVRIATAKDEEMGMVLVLGTQGREKLDFCNMLAQRLDGGVVSIEKEMPLFADASPAQKLTWFQENLRRREWPRILSDYPQDRSELRRLEGTSEEPLPRVLVAFHITTGGFVPGAKQADRHCASNALKQDGRLVRLPMDEQWTAQNRLENWWKVAAPALRRAGLPVRVNLTKEQCAIRIQRHLRSAMGSIAIMVGQDESIEQVSKGSTSSTQDQQDPPKQSTEITDPSDQQLVSPPGAAKRIGYLHQPSPAMHQRPRTAPPEANYKTLGATELMTGSALAYYPDFEKPRLLRELEVHMMDRVSSHLHYPKPPQRPHQAWMTPRTRRMNPVGISTTYSLVPLPLEVPDWANELRIQALRRCIPKELPNSPRYQSSARRSSKEENLQLRPVPKYRQAPKRPLAREIVAPLVTPRHYGCRT